MALAIEQFTSPGKYEIDKSFEKIEAQLKIPKKILSDITSDYFRPKQNQIKYANKKN